MFTQPKTLPPGLCEKEDLVDDLPDFQTWEAPFRAVSREPDGFLGIDAFWEVVDANESTIANFFCRDAACYVVRMLNNRNEAPDAPVGNKVVIQFRR